MNIDLSSIRHVGTGLRRPESVIATARGELFVSDHDCGVRALASPPTRPLGMPEGFLPNGIALTPEREFLIANLGTTCGGGVWRLDRQHQLRPWLMEVDGQPLPSTNFVSTSLTWLCTWHHTKHSTNGICQCLTLFFGCFYRGHLAANLKHFALFAHLLLVTC